MEKTIDVSFPGGKRVDAVVDGRVIATDQPAGSGGTDSSPSPFYLFLASLATCAGYFALEFCQSRNLPTEGLGVRMLCHRDEDKKLFTRMRIEMTLPAGFPEKYRDAIQRAVDLCTVKRHILSAPELETVLV